MDTLRSYPELAMFELKAFYEKEPESRADIERLIGRYSGFEFQSKQIKLDPEQFICGLDPDVFEQDYLKMIDHWKKIYLRNGAEK